ncbi:MAG: amidohydrolase family protein [Capsulimonadaceae bacterium]
MIIDFHCHITTPGSKFPEPDGNYYRSVAPINSATNLIGQMAHEAVDLLAERWRSPRALKAYRNMSPVIFTEMSRRMMVTDASVLLGEMAANGVSKSVVVAMDPIVPTAEVLQACEHRQDLLLPFGSVDCQAVDYEEQFARLLTLPVAGIKYHADLQQIPMESPRLGRMMEILAASPSSNLPVYLHTGNFPIYRPLASPWEESLPKLLAAFPTITFVCGHAGWDHPRAALKAALRCPNLYLETSWQPPPAIRRLCDKLGPERLLFGSDFPLFAQTRALRNVRSALTDVEFALVTEGNARRLLRLT